MLKKSILVFLLCFSTYVSASVKEAINAYDNKDYASAYNLFKPEAVKGNAIAQAYLGIMFTQGLFVQKDFNTAARWYEKSANNGNLYSMYEIAKDYYVGLGVNVDKQKAIHFLKKLNKYTPKTDSKDLALARGLMSNIYSSFGTKDGYQKSIYWKKQQYNASKKPEIIHTIGNIYFYDLKDLKNAYKFYSKALKMGYTKSRSYIDEICQKEPSACK